VAHGQQGLHPDHQEQRGEEGGAEAQRAPATYVWCGQRGQGQADAGQPEPDGPARIARPPVRGRAGLSSTAVMRSILADPAGPAMSLRAGGV
jgi:hypothetical protein